MNLPSLANFTMRALVLPPWPSATKMSPFGATSTSEGALNVSWPVAGDAGLAERHQHLAVRAELHDQPGPCRSCALAVGDPDVAVAVDVQAVREDEHARRRSSSPACRRRRTSGSARCSEPAQVLAPQRSNTQRLLPSRSKSRPMRHAPFAAFGQLGPVLLGAVRIGRGVRAVLGACNRRSAERERGEHGGERDIHAVMSYGDASQGAFL